jgi:predicted RNase H-like HicB family nuclease
MKISSRTYTLAIEKYPDGYLAYFPALPGCNTWGKTYEDAIKYAEEALSVYLDALMAHGDEIPEEKINTKPISLGITVRTPIVA